MRSRLWSHLLHAVIRVKLWLPVTEPTCKPRCLGECFNHKFTSVNAGWFSHNTVEYVSCMLTLNQSPHRRKASLPVTTRRLPRANPHVSSLHISHELASLQISVVIPAMTSAGRLESMAAAALRSHQTLLCFLSCALCGAWTSAYRWYPPVTGML